LATRRRSSARGGPTAARGTTGRGGSAGRRPHHRWARRWWPKNRWPRSIDRWRAALWKAIPVVVVEGAARVPGPPNVPGAPVSVERERDDRYSDHRWAGRNDYRTAGPDRLQEGRVYPTAVQTKLHVAPAEALHAAEHLHSRAGRHDHDRGIKDVGTRTHVHACGESCSDLRDGTGCPPAENQRQRSSAEADDPYRLPRVHVSTCSGSGGSLTGHAPRSPSFG